MRQLAIEGYEFKPEFENAWRFNRAEKVYKPFTSFSTTAG